MTITPAKQRPCTRWTPRCADARQYTSALRSCCRTHVRGITLAVATLLADAGITFWADYGTLLGAVRNPLTSWADYPWLQGSGPIAPGIVPHDKDSDFGVVMSDWQKAFKLLKQPTKKHPFNVLIRHEGRKIKVRLSRLNHTNLDVFFWDERPDGTLFRPHYAKVDACKGREFHRSLLFPLNTCTWEGATLPAPAKPQEFLAMRYGPNWMTPVCANHDGVIR